MVYRIKEIREKTMRDNIKKEIDSEQKQKLLQTRNLFRNRVRQEQNIKTKKENQKFLKRIINAKSQYNLAVTAGFQHEGTNRKNNSNLSRVMNSIYPQNSKSNLKSAIKIV